MNYRLLGHISKLGNVLMCGVCSALILDTDEAQKSHTDFHALSKIPYPRDDYNKEALKVGCPVCEADINAPCESPDGRIKRSCHLNRYKRALEVLH